MYHIELLSNISLDYLDIVIFITEGIINICLENYVYREGMAKQ